MNINTIAGRINNAATSLNEKRDKIKLLASITIILAACFVIAPLAFMLFKGIIAVIFAGLAGIATIAFAPYVSMKFANWRVKAIVSEATNNPIETVTNLLIAKEEAFNRFKEQVEISVAARDTFKQKCEVFSKKYPSRAGEFQIKLDEMSSRVSQQKIALRDAQNRLAESHDKLDEMKAYWDMSCATIEMNKAAGMDTGDIYERLKADTACDAVFNSMNKAFAQLEVAACINVVPVDLANTTQLQYAVPANNSVTGSVASAEKVK